MGIYCAWGYETNNNMDNNGGIMWYSGYSFRSTINPNLGINWGWPSFFIFLWSYLEGRGTYKSSSYPYKLVFTPFFSAPYHCLCLDNMQFYTRINQVVSHNPQAPWVLTTTQLVKVNIVPLVKNEVVALVYRVYPSMIIVRWWLILFPLKKQEQPF